MVSVSAAEIVQCYGKFRIEDRKDQCARRHECPWGEACLSRANEEADNVHYHLANISVGTMLFDPNRDYDDENNSGTFEYNSDNEENEAMAQKEMLNADTETAVAGDGNVNLENVTIPGEDYDIVKMAMERIADMYFNTPVAFEMLMKSIFKGRNQADVAKEKGITRQGLNKRLLYELGIAKKRNDIQQRRDRELAIAKQNYENAVNDVRAQREAMRYMTETELAVYKICGEDGCLSVSSIARQTGFSRPTIYAALHNLSRKYGINLHIQNYSRKKSQKK